MRLRCDPGPGGLNAVLKAPEKFRSDSPLRSENAGTSLIRHFIVPLGARPNAMRIRSARVPSLLLVASLAAGNAWAQHDDGRWRGHERREERSSLSDSVRRFERESGGGQVLSAERVPFDGRDVNRVKVVDSSGRVRVYMDDPQQRGGRRDDDRPTRRDDNNND